MLDTEFCFVCSKVCFVRIDLLSTYLLRGIGVKGAR